MKKTTVIILSVMLVLCMSGCALVPSVELTEDEQSIIAEYAAGLLLKYDKNYSGSISKIDENAEEEGVLLYEEEEELPDITEIIEEEAQSDFTDPDFSEDLSAESQSDAPHETEYSLESIAEAIGLDGFTVMYKDYETHNIYPEENSDELVFSLQAQEGMELIILNFGITNDSSEKRVCDILNADCNFRLVINDSEIVQANKTILLDDFASYNEEVEGYGMTNAVLVFETSAGTSQNISKLDLRIKRDGITTVHKLR